MPITPIWWREPSGRTASWPTLTIGTALSTPGSAATAGVVEAGSVTFELNGPGIPAGTIQASASTESTVVLISWLSPALIPVSKRVSPKTTAAPTTAMPNCRRRN